MKQSLELNNMGLAPMHPCELQEVDGGYLLEPITFNDGCRVFGFLCGGVVSVVKQAFDLSN